MHFEVGGRDHEIKNTSGLWKLRVVSKQIILKEKKQNTGFLQKEHSPAETLIFNF